MKKVMLSLFMLCMLLSGCTAKEEKKPTSGFCDDEKSTSCGIGGSDMSAYVGFNDKNNIFIKSNMAEAIKLFDDKKSGILYFGYPECPWCVEALPIMDNVAKENKKNIYYIETRDREKKSTYTDEQKDTMIKKMKKYLKKDDEGNYKIFVPFVVVLKDGNIVSTHLGTVDGHDSHERKMTAKEKATLQATYEDMFS